MKTLVVGGGGREHALAWALRRAGHHVIAAPGNPGIVAEATCHAVKSDDVEGQIALAVKEAVELIVVGPEAPLCAGLADAAAERKIPCFGPVRAGAVLEGSKVFSKQFFARHGIPTAEFAVCDSMAQVERTLDQLGSDVVVKADGLAAGKGVVVCGTAEQALAAARQMIEGRAFGSAGERVVIERRIRGREASIHAITDGSTFALLATAEDHKAVFDGDLGPNTGGMGVVSPTPVVTEALLTRIKDEILAPTVRGLKADGIDYRGVLYAGLMIASDGTPYLLEYNCRFGDPETEPLFLRWQGDPLPWLYGAATGSLPQGEPEFSRRAAVCVVMAAEGYPGTPRGGDEVRGIADAAALSDVVVFHAGTRLTETGTLVTAGGRVLMVTALGDDVRAARRRAYEAVDCITWDGVHCRRDIGDRPTEGYPSLKRPSP
jgi:phosphoribosylamine--glycine ligase